MPGALWEGSAAIRPMFFQGFQCIAAVPALNIFLTLLALPYLASPRLACVAVRFLLQFLSRPPPSSAPRSAPLHPSLLLLRRTCSLAPGGPDLPALTAFLADALPFLPTTDIIDITGLGAAQRKARKAGAGLARLTLLISYMTLRPYLARLDTVTPVWGPFCPPSRTGHGLQGRYRYRHASQTLSSGIPHPRLIPASPLPRYIGHLLGWLAC